MDDIEEYESYLFIGLSSLVAFNGIERSLTQNGILMSNGKSVDMYTRPTDIFSTEIYEMMIDIKEKLKEINLSQHELRFVRHWLITVGNEEKCTKYAENISPERLTEIKKFTSLIQSIGTIITRVPTFHRLFGNMLTKVISKKEELLLKFNKTHVETQV